MKTHPHYKNKGSALVTVLVLTMAVALMAGALCAYSISERKLNRHVLLRLQAQDAVEALLEYASSEIAVKFMSQSSIPTDFLSTHPVNYYLTRAPVLYAGGTNNYVSTGNFSVWASQIPAQGTLTIDPANPENANDPLKGQTVRAQQVQLLAQATATDNNGNSITDYGTQAIEVRDTSLFSFAIFYNIPMEFHPSARMDVYGPVFSNQNVYLTESAGMAFHSTFSTAAKFSAQPLDNTTGAGSARPQGQDIYFTDGLKVDSGASHPNGDTTQDFYNINNPTISGHALNTWVDSLLDTTGAPNQGNSPLDAAHGYSFSKATSTLYQGYVQDQSMDVQTQNPPGIVDPTTALKLIQPPDPTAPSGDTVEAEKFSTQSHLFIVVTPNNNGTGIGASAVAFYNPADATSYLYANSTTKNTAAQRTSWLSGANLGKVLFSSRGTVANSASGSNSLAGIVNTQRLMNDPRENKPINTVDIDLGALKTAVGTTSTPTIYTGSNSGSAWDIDGSTQKPWNGSLYVDVETDVGTPSGWATTSDIGSIAATGTETAIRLENAGTLPSRGTNTGLSVATNAPVYVVGNYNSNGTLEGGSSPTPTDVMTPDSNEVPAMVAGDSINILSNNWWSSSKPSGDGTITKSDGTYNSKPTASNTEIAAAFLTGNVPTNTSTYSYSGGVENYMRFNEDWSSATLRYRGSIVALFNSNIAKGSWDNAQYNPPTRQWGYDSKFASGGYPPNTPYLRTLRRINYSDLSGAAAFNTMLADTNYNFVKMQ